MCSCVWLCAIVKASFHAKGANVDKLSVCPGFTRLNRCLRVVEKEVREKDWLFRRKAREHDREKMREGVKVRE